MELVARFTPEPRDFTDAARAAFLGSRAARAWFAVCCVLAPWALAALHLFLHATRGRPLDAPLVTLLAGAPAIAWGAFVCLRGLQGRRLLATAPTTQGEHVYAFGPDGIVFTGPGFRNEVAWNTVTRAVRRSRGFMLFIGAHPAAFVPARGFADGAAVEAFARLLAERVGT